jgi:probable addiction module antidote protein
LEEAKMPKKKILKKQKESKGSTSGVKKFDPQKIFKEMSPEELFKVLYEIWMDKDIDSFKSVLSSYLNAHNKHKIAKNMGVSRNTLYHMISEDGNPTLATVFKLFEAIEKEAA